MRADKFICASRSTLALLVLLASASGNLGAREAAPQASASTRFTSPLNIEDSLIKFAMDRAGRAQVGIKQPGGHKLVLVPAGSAFFSLTTPGGKRFGVQLDWARVREELLQNEMGIGTRKRIPGVACAGTSTVEVELYLDHYDHIPGWVMTQLQLRVPSSAARSVAVGKVEIASLSLAALPAGQTYWSFQGPGDIREPYIRPVPAGFHKDNFLGVIEPGYGGGVPVVDLWQPKGGLALGHLEPKHQELALPIAVRAVGSVAVMIRQDVRSELRPGKTWSSPYEFVAVHHGDFYSPLRTYGDLMARRGLPRPQSPPEAYESYWCTWGYSYNFRLADIREKFPLFQKFGIPWIVIDDRWFNAAGDWEPRRDIFPRGEEDFRAMVDEFHRGGYKVQLWMVPSEVDAGLDLDAWKAAHSQLHNLSHLVPSAVQRARLLDEHPDWIILDSHGEPPVSKRGYYYLCPALPEVQNYFRASVEKWFRQWGVDGLKQDAVYICPPCYNPKHHHVSPEDAPRAYATVQKIIFETARAAKPHCVIYSCPCGVAPEYTWLPWLNQLVTADPEGNQDDRRRVKALRALGGDQVGILDRQVHSSPAPAVRVRKRVEPEEVWPLSDADFSTALGVGAVLGTDFRSLTPVQVNRYEKWFGLYHRLDLSHATYLNLYDIAFDYPETHVLRKGDRLYYAFYAHSAQEQFNGSVEFRGLTGGAYQVYDYFHDRSLPHVTRQAPWLPVSFQGFLLLELTPTAVHSSSGR